MNALTVVGARPQFIKAAPVSRAIDDWNGRHPARAIREILVHTGQHYDYEMSQVFFEELGLEAPDHHLGVGSGSHATQTAEMLLRLEPVLLKERPDVVIVYGDTNSTLAGALAASKLGIPIAHVEAGLRSFNRAMPEEVNRVLTDHVSTWLFCPTAASVENLAREGITRGVHRVVDVMYESVLANVERAERASDVLARLGLERGRYVVATVHRAENTDGDGNLARVLSALTALAEGGETVVFPVHPRTRKLLGDGAGSHERLRMIKPLSYLDMLVLEKGARAILTDSGGVQKEAYWFGVPCITLREETEWVETVASGWNRLAGVDPSRILAAYRAIVGEPRRGTAPVEPHGGAAATIVDILAPEAGGIGANDPR